MEPNKLPNRPPIPLPMKRSIRKRCGFGCVVCGLPIYEYDHMLDWALMNEHNEEQITLLCPQHHAEKTKGLLPIDAVRTANDNPHNLKSGITKPYDLHFSGSKATICLGEHFEFEHPIIADPKNGTYLVPVTIDHVGMVAFEVLDDHLLLSLVVYDEYNNIVLCIRQNEMVFKADLWDVQLTAKTLTVHEARRHILIEIIFKPPGRIEIPRARFLKNGVEFIIKPGLLEITNDSRRICGGVTIVTELAIALGVYEGLPKPMFHMPDIPRYPSTKKTR